MTHNKHNQLNELTGLTKIRISFNGRVSVITYREFDSGLSQGTYTEIDIRLKASTTMLKKVNIHILILKFERKIEMFYDKPKILPHFFLSQASKTYQM